MSTKYVTLCYECAQNYFLEDQPVESDETCYKCGYKIDKARGEMFSVLNKDEVERIDYCNDMQSFKANLALVLSIVIILTFSFVFIKGC